MDCEAQPQAQPHQATKYVVCFFSLSPSIATPGYSQPLIIYNISKLDVAEISLGAVLTATFTAAQYAITAISRYRAAPSELQAVGRKVASFKCLMRQIQRISTSTSRRGIHLSGVFIQVLDAAKIGLNELIRYLNRHRQLTVWIASKLMSSS